MDGRQRHKDRSRRNLPLRIRHRIPHPSPLILALRPAHQCSKEQPTTLRTIATVGNYDFMIEYNFFYDGVIEVSARASGYISAAFWAQDPVYGFHIHDFLSGSIHDHTLTFKADFDILGTKNSVQKFQSVPTSTTYPWSQGRVHNTFKASRSFLADESEASIN
jgi:primary-amine oxidase